MTDPIWRGRFPRNDIISLLDVNRRHNLAESTSRNLRFGELLDLIGDDAAVRDIELGYGSSAGLPALREVIARDHGVAADCVIVTQGTSQGLFLLAFELLRHGERALLLTPCFPPTRDALTACGVTIDELTLRFDDGYRIDVAKTAALLRPDTRLVSIASPQNPSGVATSHEDLRALLDAMAQRAPQALLFVDETYRAAAYGDETTRASAATLDPRVIVGASVSKAHGAPGLRTGWLTLSDAMLRERLIVAKMNIAISGSTLDEALAAKLLEQGAKALASRRAHLAQALATLTAWCERESAAVEWVRPQAGALCCVRLRQDVYDDAAVTRFWAGLADSELQLASGEWFGDADGARVFRLGFGFLPADELVPALEAVSEALARSRVTTR